MDRLAPRSAVDRLLALVPRSRADEPSRRAPVGLTSLAVGAEARFHGTTLGRADLELLEGLGLTGSCHLRVCQAGDPWIVQVRATRIGIADSVARAILVVPEGTP
jgi:Fe2+ transport system protein FeoA